MSTVTDPNSLIFGRIVVQPGRRQVLVGGEPAKLGARAFDVLMMLIENRERVVGREELFERVWPGRVVEDHNLTVQISALRTLFGPDAIVNVSGRGYRFTAELASGPRLESASDTAEAGPDKAAWKHIPHWRWWASLAFAMVLGYLGIARFGNNGA